MAQIKECNPRLRSRLVSDSLRGRIGVTARRWKGMRASYVAKHMWIYKYYGKASFCTNDQSHLAKRFEWANISGNYLRERTDYKPLCPSCHRRMDMKNKCHRGHEYTKENTITNCRGHRRCRICMEKRNAVN